MNPLKLQWQLRAHPLLPEAVLVQRKDLKHLKPENLQRLRGVYTDSALVLMGAEADLPWLPGQTYLGIDPGAPQLYLSTFRAPSIPVDMLQQGIFSHWGEGIYAIDPVNKQIIPLHNALTVEVDILQHVFDAALA